VSYEYRCSWFTRRMNRPSCTSPPNLCGTGMVIEVERPGSELDARSVIVYSVLAHPLDEGQGSPTPESRLGW
jgi:hypothetical protein